MTIKNMTKSPAPDERLNSIQTRIQDACHQDRRGPSSLRLLAVSKGQPVASIRALADLNQRSFGENYLDEGLKKIQALSALDLEWHFIGPIQSNKTRAIAEHFDWVQSVDREKIIRRLADQRPATMPPLNVLIQVNVDGEQQKAGCSPDQIEALAEAVAQRPCLRLRGLMAIPAPREQQPDQIAVFRRLHGLYSNLQAAHPDVDTLSAGMSTDLEAAILAGSTMVRIGTDLFGPRTRTEQP